MKVILIFCGAGLLLSLVVAMAYGVDLAAQLLARQQARTLTTVRSTAGADELKTVAIFCGLGLLLSLVAAMSYGLDLTAF